AFAPKLLNANVAAEPLIKSRRFRLIFFIFSGLNFIIGMKI
ncbi:MAG: hypothetical protein ACJARG_000266, partial [Arcticibacterium sp.]